MSIINDGIRQFSAEELNRLAEEELQRESQTYLKNYIKYVCDGLQTIWTDNGTDERIITQINDDCISLYSKKGLLAKIFVFWDYKPQDPKLNCKPVIFLNKQILYQKIFIVGGVNVCGQWIKYDTLELAKYIGQYL